MKISINWLRDFVNIPEKTNLKELAQNFTLRTAEVEHIEDQAELFENIVVGRIEKIEDHPNADKLKVTRVNVGGAKGAELQIVCGGPNIAENMYVPVALEGARVRWHGEGDLVTLENAKIRGVESFGMICAGDEIGLAPTPEGILDLESLDNFDPKKSTPGLGLAQALNKTDFIFEVDNKSITHRPDLWGHYGIAREIAALTNQKLKPITSKVDYPTTTTKNTSPMPLTVEVEDKKLCPRYIGVLMEGIEIGPSPEWLKQKLEAVGYRSISNIVDATNFVMAELGQPMHAFDAHKIDTGIIVRTAKNGEKITTLDDTERKLTDEMLVIADHKKAIAIAGVMGGANSEIEDKTTNIILESANFNPQSIRRTSTALGLRTEAVQRFEKSLDPVLAETAMDRLVELILQLCPNAKIVSPKIDAAHFDTKQKTITLDLDRVQNKIGIEIKPAEVKKILTSLQFEIKDSATKTEKQTLSVTIPSWRATKDVDIEDDLVEEIARIYGYENIEAKLPLLPSKLPEENTERILKHRARQILSLGLGFTEVFNYSFYSKQDIQKSLIPEELHINVDNYLSEDQTHMRVSLLPGLLKDAAENLKQRHEFKIYEIGRTYEDLQEYFPIEQKKICGVIVRQHTKQSKNAEPNSTNPEDTFFEAKGALEELLNYYNTSALKLEKGIALCPYAHPNKYASYVLEQTGGDKIEIARVFTLHPIVAKNYELEQIQLAAFEVNFTELAKLGLRVTDYQPIPKYPTIEIDVSVLIDKKTEVERIHRAIEQADHTLINKIELFDLYEGSNIPDNKKSVAYRITLLSPDRTLTDAEMKDIQEKIFANIKKVGGEIRS